MEDGMESTETAGSDLLKNAGAELSAFYGAVRVDQGSVAAVLAAGFWLSLFARAETTTTQKRDLRRISIHAADLWAAHLAAESRVTGRARVQSPFNLSPGPGWLWQPETRSRREDSAEKRPPRLACRRD